MPRHSDEDDDGSGNESEEHHEDDDPDAAARAQGDGFPLREVRFGFLLSFPDISRTASKTRTSMLRERICLVFFVNLRLHKL
ncbi:MAG: hypothetical protein JW384_02266 [Nitrosomonadaceae bacterium]|nr:hypothetical protein [Nitrosomonadaceae bacterium]